MPSKSTKSSKGGLKEFARAVAERVFARQSTSYSEVADDLVKHNHDKSLSESNLRRRVYDALNVLRALDIIETENRSIRWKGFSEMESLLSASGELERSATVGAEVQSLKQQIHEKKALLQSLCRQDVFLKCLVKRNQQVPVQPSPQRRLQHPFFLVSTPQGSGVSFSHSLDKSEASVFLNAEYSIRSSQDILSHADPYDFFPSESVDQAYYNLPPSCWAYSDSMGGSS
ncbi:hypothetical protein GEMRC1_007701 [Eukaryota sp. GEM-RC1]